MAQRSSDAKDMAKTDKASKPKAGAVANAGASWEENNGYSAPASKYLEYTQGMPTAGSANGTGGAGGSGTKRKKPEMSIAARRLAKVDTRGMKSMMSFFGKKDK
jgi:hypothetical protein